ncbi:MAG: hypothetical protein AAFO77_02390 [Pseudomonadota bacterium]
MSPYFSNRKHQKRFDARGKPINPLEDPLNYPEMTDFAELLDAIHALKRTCRRLVFRIKKARRARKSGAPVTAVKPA